MALYKEMELESGITVKYHRIVSINKITNVQNTIEVASYTNKAKREEEKQAIEKGQTMNVFINTDYISAEYDESLTIEDAYDYLKTLDRFKNAEDC